jgi:hypothetical protein
MKEPQPFAVLFRERPAAPIRVNIGFGSLGFFHAWSSIGEAKKPSQGMAKKGRPMAVRFQIAFLRTSLDVDAVDDYGQLLFIDYC